MGCDIIGFDINPMAYWIVKEEIEHLDLQEYVRSAAALREQLEQDVGPLYRTRCLLCGSEQAHVKYFLWVKTLVCGQCEARRPVPGLPALNGLAPSAERLRLPCLWRADGSRGQAKARRLPALLQPAHARRAGPERPLHMRPMRTQNTSPAIHWPAPAPALRHRVHCPSCKPGHRGRFFKAPDAEDLRRAQEAEDGSGQLGRRTRARRRDTFRRRNEPPSPLGVSALSRDVQRPPAIRPGDVCQNHRRRRPNARVHNALATNLSDLLRYQNMLCRYDTTAFKSLDIFSVHGFPVGSFSANPIYLESWTPEAIPASAAADGQTSSRSSTGEGILRRALRSPVPGKKKGDRSDRGGVDRGQSER